MGCGCRKNRSNDQRTARIEGSGRYEIWVGGTYSGRRYTSLVRAQEVADRLGGEVRAN